MILVLVLYVVVLATGRTLYMSSENGTDTGICSTPATTCRTFSYTQDKSNDNDEIFIFSMLEKSVIVKKTLIFKSNPEILFHGHPSFTIDPNVENVEFRDMVFSNYYAPVISKTSSDVTSASVKFSNVEFKICVLPQNSSILDIYGGSQSFVNVQFRYNTGRLLTSRAVEELQMNNVTLGFNTIVGSIEDSLAFINVIISEDVVLNHLNINANEGKIMYLLENKLIELKNSEFENNNKFDNALYFFDVQSVTVTNCHFKNHFEFTQSVLSIFFLFVGTKISIDSCTFSSNQASVGFGQGACVAINVPQISRNFDAHSVSITNSDFENNIAENGGVFFFIGALNVVSMKNTKMRLNSAWGLGGVVFALANSRDRQLDLRDILEWAGNQADIGGTFFVENEMNILYDEMKISSWARLFGDIFASPPCKFSFMNLTDADSRIREFPRRYNYTDDVVQSSVFPGELLSLELGLLDCYDNEIEFMWIYSMETYFSGLSFEYSIDAPEVISKIVEYDKKGSLNSKGVLVFKNIAFILQDDPMTVGNLSITIYSPQCSSFQPVKVNFTMDLCAPFYELVHLEKDENQIWSCEQCGKDFFKINHANDECKKCLIGAECENGEILSEENFWLWTDDKSGEVESFICLQGECVPGGCEEFAHRNASFPLCEVCDEGYTKLYDDCVDVNGGYFLFFLLATVKIFAFLVLLHWSANSLELGYDTKVLIFFTQTLFIMRGGEFQVYQKKITSGNDVLKWLSGFMEGIKYFINFIYGAGYAVNGIPGLDSFAAFEISPYLFLWFRTFLMVFSIVFFLVIFLGLYSVYQLCYLKRKEKKFVINLVEIDQSSNLDEPLLPAIFKKKKSKKAEKPKKPKVNCWKKVMLYYRKKFFGIRPVFKTFLFAFLLSFEVLLDEIFVFFQCKSFGHERRLVEFPSVKCFDSVEYYLWSVYYIVLLIILIIFPFFILIFLIANRKKFHNKLFEEYYGELYEDYKKPYFWYEFVQLSKRFLLVFLCFLCQVVVPESEYEVSYLSMAILLLIFLFLHVLLQPFKHFYGNFLEFTALVMLLFITVLRMSALSADSYPVYLMIEIISFCTLMFLFVNVYVNRWCCTRRKKLKKLKKKKKDVEIPIEEGEIEKSKEGEEEEEEIGELSEDEEELSDSSEEEEEAQENEIFSQEIVKL